MQGEHGHLSREQKQWALRLHARGWRLVDIAAEIGCSAPMVGIMVRDGRHLDAEPFGWQPRPGHLTIGEREQILLGLRPGGHAVIYSYWFLDTARVAMLLASDLRARGVVVDRLVSRAHGYDLYPDRSPLGHLPERELLLGAFDAVCPISDQGRRALVAQCPRYADKIGTHRLGTADPGREATCSREPFHIVSCAYLLPVKRMTRMPAVLAELRRRGVDARWTHLGGGPEAGDVLAAARHRMRTAPLLPDKPVVLGRPAGLHDGGRLPGHPPHRHRRRRGP